MDADGIDVTASPSRQRGQAPAPSTANRRGSIVRSILKHHEAQAQRNTQKKGRRGSVAEGGQAAVAAQIGRRGSLSLLPEIDRVAGTALEELLAVVPKLTSDETAVYRRSATAAALRRMDRTIAWQAARRQHARARMDALGGEGLVPTQVAECIGDILRRGAFQGYQDGTDALTALDAFKQAQGRETAEREAATVLKQQGGSTGASRTAETGGPTPTAHRTAGDDLAERARVRSAKLLSKVEEARAMIHPVSIAMGMARVVLQAYLEMPHDAVLAKQLHQATGPASDFDQFRSVVDAIQAAGDTTGDPVANAAAVPAVVWRADAIPSELADTSPDAPQPKSPPRRSRSPTRGSSAAAAHEHDSHDRLQDIETEVLQHCLPDMQIGEGKVRA